MTRASKNTISNNLGFFIKMEHAFKVYLRPSFNYIDQYLLIENRKAQYH